MHNCEWELQKNQPEEIACDLVHVPTVYDFMLKSDTSGKKYFFDGVSEFKTDPSTVILNEETVICF